VIAGRSVGRTSVGDGSGTGNGTTVQDTGTTAVFPSPYVTVTDPGPNSACKSAVIDTVISAESPAARVPDAESSASPPAEVDADHDTDPPYAETLITPDCPVPRSRELVTTSLTSGAETGCEDDWDGSWPFPPPEGADGPCGA
jgi:hypothetical protein